MSSEHQNGAGTIVLVEDNEVVRRLVRRLLELEGYRIHEATSGGEALEILASSERGADLLLTDLMLDGGMNGIELGHHALRLQPELKLLCMSGYGDEAVIADSVLAAATATAFLSKPFVPAELTAAVRGLLSEPQSETAVSGVAI